MRARFLAVAPVLAAALAGCGAQQASTSSGDFKGESKAVAQTIDDLSKAGTKSDEKAICNTILSRALVRRLDAGGGTCVRAVSDQIDTADTSAIKVERVAVTGATATAVVTSKVQGHDRRQTLRLVRENGAWRIDGLG